MFIVAFVKVVKHNYFGKLIGLLRFLLLSSCSFENSKL